MQRGNCKAGTVQEFQNKGTGWQKQLKDFWSDCSTNKYNANEHISHKFKTDRQTDEVLFCMYKQLPVKLEYILYFEIIGRVQFILYVCIQANNF